MSKIVVFFFFLVAVAIFALLKLASRGIKEGYRYVNQDAAPNRVEQPKIVKDAEFEVVKLIIKLLDIQKSFIADENGQLPVEAEGTFARGYIAGFSDLFLQRIGVSEDAASFTLISIVFSEVFGEKKGPALAGLFLNEQTLLSTRAGVERGARDALDYTRNPEELPSGWMDYVSGQQGR